MSGNQLNASVLPDPLPQVGAVLHLDTRLPQKDLLSGSRHWKLAGSCVLAAPDRVLTIRHILDPLEQVAVFFPYEGLFRKHADARQSEQPSGDSLMLVRLDRAVGYAAPFRHEKIAASWRYQGHATVCGYGRWPGAPLNGVDGLQRRFQVELGLPAMNSEAIRYDNLDLMWASSRNGRLAAGRGNSGGPVLWGENGSFRYIGINRERKRQGHYDLQLGSWIGWERKNWLDASVGEPPPPSPSLGRESRTVAVSRTEPSVITVRPPAGARQVRCTLNAGKGLRLQMGVTEGSPSADFLRSLTHDNDASGRFLYRKLDLSGQAQQVSIGVAAVARAPFEAERVLAQVCCLYL